MSGLSPARRIREKTSDLTDFFRGHNAHHPRQVQSDTETYVSTSTLEVPGPGETSGSGLTKKKTTRIPFLGRTRKKSNQSTTSNPFSYASGTDRESSDVAERLSRAGSSDQPSAYIRSESPTSPPPLPIKVPSIKTPSPSIGSKFAAHFSAARSRKPPSLHPGRSSPTPSAHGTLSPPLPSPRSTSFDSGSSGASRNRSSTPRPAQPSIAAQPVITVSFSGDSNEEYRDLFTLPQNRTANRVIPLSQPPSRHASTRRRDGDSDSTPRSTPPLDQPMRSMTSDDPCASTSTAPQPTHRKQDSPRSSNDDKLSASPSLRSPRLQSSSAPKRADSALDVEKSKPALLKREGSSSTRFPVKPSATPAQLYATATRTPAPSTDDSTSATKSRIRTPSTASDRRSSSRPPSMPLPAPPTSGSPRSAAPDFPNTSPPSSPLPDILTNHKPLLRARANTIGTVSKTPGTNSPGVPPSSPSALESTPKATPDHPIKPPPNFDVNMATCEELKAALILRNQQYDELASYLLRITEGHVAETVALEKKVSAMEREAARKDKEIKGLTWLVVNNRGPPAGPIATGVSGSVTASSRSPSTLDSDRGSASSPSFVSSRMSIRRFQNLDDSGAESYPTSGGESIRGSGTSGTESVSSSTRDKRSRRPFTLGESSYNLYRASTTGKRMTDSARANALRNDQLASNAPYSATSAKRSSASSLSPSPSSSSSSLLPPSPSITVSSLSAIPEASSPTIQHSKEPDDQSQGGSRSAKRLSQSSVASSSTAASSYGTNVKRSRPPSIAQVLEKSQKTASMEDLLEKLRFGKLPPSPSP